MSKRAETARDILLERGVVTTAELNQLGYDHPPRAIGDLRDAGVTVIRKMISVGGRRMAQYSLVDTKGSMERGRIPLPKRFREALYDEYHYRCAICGGTYTSRELQADHRVPFRISGDPKVLALDDFMPLCGSDNRAKSWTCEHCVNWERKDTSMCRTCYWASPDEYSHIAGVAERRLILAIRGDDVVTFDSIKAAADAAGISLGEWVLQRFARLLMNDSPED